MTYDTNSNVFLSRINMYRCTEQNDMEKLIKDKKILPNQHGHSKEAIEDFKKGKYNHPNIKYLDLNVKKNDLVVIYKKKSKKLLLVEIISNETKYGEFPEIKVIKENNKVIHVLSKDNQKFLKYKDNDKYEISNFNCIYKKIKILQEFDKNDYDIFKNKIFTSSFTSIIKNKNKFIDIINVIINKNKNNDSDDEKQGSDENSDIEEYELISNSENEDGMELIISSNEHKKMKEEIEKLRKLIKEKDERFSELFIELEKEQHKNEDIKNYLNKVGSHLQQFF